MTKLLVVALIASLFAFFYKLDVEAKTQRNEEMRRIALDATCHALVAAALVGSCTVLDAQKETK